MSAREDLGRRIKLIIKLIEILDACRIGRTEEAVRIEKLYKELNPSGAPVRLKNIRRSIKEIREIAIKDKNFKAVKRYSKLSNYMSYIGIIMATFIVILVSFMKIDAKLYSALFTSLVIIVYLSFLFKWYAENHLLRIYSDNVDKLMAKGEPLKNFINYLIKMLNRELKRHKLNASRYRLHLYLSDYDNIKVIKKPGKLREKYIVEVT